MPLIDFRDVVTGEVEEVLFKSQNVPDTIISAKTGNECVRIMSAPGGFKLIGGGFYANEYPKS